MSKLESGQAILYLAVVNDHHVGRLQGIFDIPKVSYDVGANPPRPKALSYAEMVTACARFN